MMVEAVIAVVVPRMPVHGDSAESPRPMPSTSRISDSAADAVAPAKMAGQEMAPLDWPADLARPTDASSSSMMTVAIAASRVALLSHSLQPAATPASRRMSAIAVGRGCSGYGQSGFARRDALAF